MALRTETGRLSWNALRRRRACLVPLKDAARYGAFSTACRCDRGVASTKGCHLRWRGRRARRARPRFLRAHARRRQYLLRRLRSPLAEWARSPRAFLCRAEEAPAHAPPEDGRDWLC